MFETTAEADRPNPIIPNHPPVAQFVPTELESIEQLGMSAEAIFALCLGFHNDFKEQWLNDSQLNPNKLSFHDAMHLIAVRKAAIDRYLVGATSNKDPLHFYSSFDILQRKYSISFQEFRHLLRIAIACHDLGNIAESAIVTGSANQRVELLFFRQHKANEAEARAATIAATIMNSHPFPDKNRMEMYVQIVQDLILQTTFQPPAGESNAPFALFMRVMDQVGNDLFNENAARIEGLLFEMLEENPEAEIKPSPYHFFNFTRERLNELLPTETNKNPQQELLEIWGKELPEEVTHYYGVPLSKDPVKVKDFLEQVAAEKVRHT